MKKLNLFIILPITIMSLFLITDHSFAEGDGHSLDAADGDPTDVVYVDNDGNLGIGTISPSNSLHVFKSTNTAIIFESERNSIVELRADSDSNNPGDDAKIRFNYQDSYKYSIGYDSSNDIFSVDSGSMLDEAPFFTINNSGNVGIGTINPKAKLDINGTSPYYSLIARDTSSGYSMRFRWTGGPDFAFVWNDGTEDRWGTDFRFDTSIEKWKFSDDLIVNGNVGIGTTNPTFSANARGLDIAGTGGIKDNPQDGTERIPTLRITDTVSDYGSGTATIGEIRGGIEFYSSETSGDLPAIASAIYDVNEHTYNIVHGLAFYTNYNAASPTEAMRIRGNGNVGIGTTSPDYKLDVLGTIRAEEVKVETGWSDFVFEDNYNLPPLETIESFIKENKHLPDIPSAREIEVNGLPMAEMIAKQMQKIEELMLYVIEQNKKMEALIAKNIELEKRLAVVEQEK